MKWGRRVALGLAVAVVVAAAAGGVLWWRVHREPEDFAGASSMDPAEAERVLRELQHPAPGRAHGPAAVDEPWDPRGGWGRKRPPSSAVVRPYHLALGERQVAAIVISRLGRQAGGQIGDIRVAVREHDLFAAGRLRGTALSGAVVSLTATPIAGRGGRLCLRLGEPRVGGQAIPEELLQQLGASAGQKIPRQLCLNPRAAGLPGPVRAVRIDGGAVVVDGVR